MPDPKSPMTDADLVQINERLSELDEADKLIDASIRAGIDIKDQRERTQELRSRLVRMKQAFFPGRT